MTKPLSLSQFELSGADSLTFLQSQLSADLKLIDTHAQISAICNLKGRADFVLWVNQSSPLEFRLAIHPSLSNKLVQHIKKYAAFSDVKLTETANTYLSLAQPSTFDAKDNPNSTDPRNQGNKPLLDFTQQTESALSLLDLIKLGISVITDETAGVFQPQELRLHELGGVSYAKGCYLGQEVVARLWFKSAPKAWLHLILCQTAAKLDPKVTEQLQVVSESEGYALVVARRAAIDLWCQEQSDWRLQPLPDYFKPSPARLQPT